MRVSRARSEYGDDVDEAAYAAWLDRRDGRGLSRRERLEVELAGLRRSFNRDPRHAPPRLREHLEAVEAELARLDAEAV